MSRKLTIVCAALLTGALFLGTTPIFAQTAPKIGVIDVEKIIRESNAGQKMVADIEAFGKGLQESLEADSAALKELQTRAANSGLSLSAERLAELNKEIETKGIALKRSKDDANREMQRRQQQSLQQIERSVMPIIQKVGAEGGYTVIFRKFDSGLIYASEQVDITSAVITALDAAPPAGGGGGG